MNGVNITINVTAVINGDVVNLPDDQVKAIVREWVGVPDANHTEDAFLTREQAAKEVGVSLSTFDKYIKQGLVTPIPRPSGGRVIFTKQSLLKQLSSER